MRLIALIAAALVFAAAALVASAALAGCGGQRAADHTTTVVQTVTGSASAPAAAAASIRLEAYHASSYTARVPTVWSLEGDQTTHGDYVESKWRDPADPHSSITIDASAGQSASAASKAEEVRAAVAHQPSYAEQSFAPSRIASHDGYQWVFRLSGDARVDYFLHECDTGVAVLGSTSPQRFAELRETFWRVAQSVAVECTGATTAPPTTRSAPPSTPPPASTGSSEADFCATHDCIPSFSEGTGSIVQCADGQWSHSGGRPGACSHHGGETDKTYP